MFILHREIHHLRRRHDARGNPKSVGDDGVDDDDDDDTFVLFRAL